MKIHPLSALVGAAFAALAFLSLGAQGRNLPANSSKNEALETLASSEDWTAVARHEFMEARVRLPPNTAPTGASAYGFRIDRQIEGMALVTNNVRGTVSVFIGWHGFAQEHVNSAPKDLRVVFAERDGAEHVTTYDAGGGSGLLFYSPSDVPIEDLGYFEVR